MTINVMLTFDFEEWGASYDLMQADLYTKTKRVVDFLTENRIPATFFLDAHTCQRYPESFELLDNDQFELALHTDFHPGAAFSRKEILDLNIISTDYYQQDSRTQIARMKNGIDMIRKIKPDFSPSGFRAPDLKWNNDLYKSLKTMGIKYDSSQKKDVYSPYDYNGVPVLPMNSGDYDSACYKIRPHHVMLIWKNNLLKAKRFEDENGESYFLLIFHPSVVGKSKYFALLKSIVNYLSWFNVKYRTCIDYFNEKVLRVV